MEAKMHKIDLKNSSYEEIVQNIFDKETERNLSLYRNSVTNMSSFQIQNFIINNELNIPRKIRQALVELNTRYHNTKSIKKEIENSKLELELLELKIDKLKQKNKTEADLYKFKKREIKIQKLENKKEEIETNIEASDKRLRSIVREINAFEEFLDQVIEQEGIEKVQEYIENHEKYEPDYWVDRFTSSATFEMIAQGRITNGLLESISNMDRRLQGQVLEKTFENFVKLRDTYDRLTNDAAKKLEQEGVIAPRLTDITEVPEVLTEAPADNKTTSTTDITD